MMRTVVLYAAAIAAGAAALQWLEYRYVVRAYSTETYVVLVALGFAALGIWLGYRLTPRGPMRGSNAIRPPSRSLGLSPREVEILDCLAAGEFEQGNGAAAWNLPQHRQDPHRARL